MNLYVNGPPEIPNDIKKVLNSLKFRWKTNIIDDNTRLSVIVMGKIRAIKMKESPLKKKIIFPAKK